MRQARRASIPGPSEAGGAGVPRTVRYSGSGSTLDASSYVGYQPKTLFDDDIKWAGYPFKSGYEEWCHLDGTGKALICARRGEQDS